MKRKSVCFVLLCVLFVLSALFVSCGDRAPEAGVVTRLTVNINPEVEFMIDDQGHVMSATALNDDGSILLVGEEFVGKTPQEAVEKLVSLAAQTGYLVKGAAADGENAVSISVSGEDRYAKALSDAVCKEAQRVLESLDIEGAVQKAEALSLEALRALALSTSLYTEEELEAMDAPELYLVIAKGREETAALLTAELREAYDSAKEYRIAFVESEQVAGVIEGMGGLYTLTHVAYKTALELFSTAITELDEFRYDVLVSPESEYQKSLAALREAKTELLKQKNYTASLDINGEEYASASLVLSADEESYDRALAAYEALGTKIREALEAQIARLREAEAGLVELESTLFDANIEAKLKEKALEIEAKVNEAKDTFFAEFEQQHADDIAAIHAALLEKKQQLKAELEAVE